MSIKIHEILKLFRVVGESRFVKRFKDFLAHGGRTSRTDVLEKTVRVMQEMEKTKRLQIQNATEVVALMQAAGFSPAQIRVSLARHEELTDLTQALQTLLHYVESGNLSVQTDTNADEATSADRTASEPESRPPSLTTDRIVTYSRRARYINPALLGSRTTSIHTHYICDAETKRLMVTGATQKGNQREQETAALRLLNPILTDPAEEQKVLHRHKPGRKKKKKKSR